MSTVVAARIADEGEQHAEPLPHRELLAAHEKVQPERARRHGGGDPLDVICWKPHSAVSSNITETAA